MVFQFSHCFKVVMAEESQSPTTLKELFENEEFLTLLSDSLKSANGERSKVNLPTEKIQTKIADEETKPTNGHRIRPNSKQNITLERLLTRRLQDKINEFEALMNSLNTFMKISVETFVLHGTKRF